MKLFQIALVLATTTVLSGCGANSEEWDGGPYYGNKSYWEDRAHWGDEFYGVPKNEWYELTPEERLKARREADEE
jgi:uncharacterized protein YceK